MLHLKTRFIVGVLKWNFRKVVQVCRPWNSPENTPEIQWIYANVQIVSILVIWLPTRTEFGHSIIDAHGRNICNLNHLPWRHKIMSTINDSLTLVTKLKQAILFTCAIESRFMGTTEYIDSAKATLNNTHNCYRLNDCYTSEIDCSMLVQFTNAKEIYISRRRRSRKSNF